MKIEEALKRYNKTHKTDVVAILYDDGSGRIMVNAIFPYEKEPIYGIKGGGTEAAIVGGGLRGIVEPAEDAFLPF